MEIEATAYLRYWHGESITTAPERLELVVKFKERKKIFKTKLVECLVSVRNGVLRDLNYDSYDSYLDRLEEVVNDKEYLIRVTKEVVEEYFKEKYDNATNDDRLNSILKRANDEIGKIEVTVKIDKM